MSRHPKHDVEQSHLRPHRQLLARIRRGFKPSKTDLNDRFPPRLHLLKLSFLPPNSAIN